MRLGLAWTLVLMGLAAQTARAGKAEPVLGVTGLDEVSQRIMLETHNEWRRQLGLDELAWSESLAQSAQAWAEHLATTSCDMTHSQDRDYGENLAWSAGRRLSPDRVVNLWGHEKRHYDPKTNRCAERQICGHYTQMVWKDTRELGCGRAICGGAEVWACHYWPQGNIRGETPY